MTARVFRAQPYCNDPPYLFHVANYCTDVPSVMAFMEEMDREREELLREQWRDYHYDVVLPHDR